MCTHVYLKATERYLVINQHSKKLINISTPIEEEDNKYRYLISLIDSVDLKKGADRDIPHYE